MAGREETLRWLCVGDWLLFCLIWWYCFSVSKTGARDPTFDFLGKIQSWSVAVRFARACGVCVAVSTGSCLEELRAVDVPRSTCLCSPCAASPTNLAGLLYLRMFCQTRCADLQHVCSQMLQRTLGHGARGAVGLNSLALRSALDYSIKYKHNRASLNGLGWAYGKRCKRHWGTFSTSNILCDFLSLSSSRFFCTRMQSICTQTLKWPKSTLKWNLQSYSSWSPLDCLH